uniref:Uncharacterized protein n=1 Tax=Amphora coffeiformis TaxID=265554 RepID=A0A7S3L075_9STRA
MSDSNTLSDPFLHSELVVSVNDLQVARPDQFPVILKSLLDRQVERLHRRVGLVPNYFMTRGEANGASLGNKVAGKIFKLFYQRDFREEETYAEFAAIVKSIAASTSQQQDSAFNAQVARVLNLQKFQGGNSLLHVLVRRRHLRFLRTLLLHVSHLLDLDQRNTAGYSALDLAVDRLEVEAFYLFILHGASTTRTVPRSSLGYAEFLAYDLFANLDTGRWLHKQSESATMEHLAASLSLESRRAFVEWTTGGVMKIDTLQCLGYRIPRLFTIVLADGCDAITNHEAWATIVRHMSFLRDRVQVEQSDEESLRSIATGITPEPTHCSCLFDFLAEQGADTSHFRTAGRTVFFNCHDGNEIAVKLSKSSENSKSPHPLAKEANMNTTIAEFKQKHGLRSEYPVTVQLLQLSYVPENIREAIQREQAAGFHAFTVPPDTKGVLALVYRPPANYSLYINDPALSLDVYRSGIEKAGHDAAVLASHGLYHGAVVDIQHDASREQRPHLWSFESFLTRFRGGAGRIEGGFAGLSAPNARVSGLADLKHIIDGAQVISRYDPSVIHAQHNILYDDNERACVSVVEQLGAPLFATVLLAASSWQSRHIQGVQENLDLVQELNNCFSTFLCGYLEIEKDKAEKFLETIGTNFELMASQIKMFSTSNYVTTAETAPRRPIFGFFAKVLGWFTHPTAFLHFAQRGSMDLSKPGKSVPGIRACYEPYTRVDTSMMRCSPTWVGGKGWVNPKTGQAHFGSYEGVLPFQQLIRDLYATVYLAWLVRRHGKDAFELFT